MAREFEVKVEEQPGRFARVVKLIEAHRVISAGVLSLITGIATAILRPLERADVVDSAQWLVRTLGAGAVVPWWIVLLWGAIAVVGVGVLVQRAAVRLTRVRPEPFRPHATFVEATLQGVVCRWQWLSRGSGEPRVSGLRIFCADCDCELGFQKSIRMPIGVFRCPHCNTERDPGTASQQFRDGLQAEIERRARAIDRGTPIETLSEDARR